MKSKKLLLPAIIFTSAIVIMVLYSVITGIAKKPTITQKDFPFSITYELDGEVETVDAIYSVTFIGNDGYVDSTTRQYEGRVISSRKDVDTSFDLKNTDEVTITLHTHLYADYLMGDPLYDYFAHESFEPTLVYYDNMDYSVFEDAESLSAHGVKLISWEYPEPIENEFVFSHISYLSSDAVFPLALIAALALLAVILLVKKDENFVRQRFDTISVVLNFVIAVTAVPFLTVYGWLSDINGSSPDFTQQFGYLLPAITILGLAASVSLRRKQFRKSGFIAQFAGPAAFAILFLFLLLGF